MKPTPCIQSSTEHMESAIVASEPGPLDLIAWLISANLVDGKRVSIPARQVSVAFIPQYFTNSLMIDLISPLEM